MNERPQPILRGGQSFIVGMLVPNTFRSTNAQQTAFGVLSEQHK
jgi:hypothetical protein